jgi:uncharacterized protein involved in exopolysaccharide biosynthesis
VQALGTSEFLDNQLVEAGKRLRDQEALLGQYKQKFSGQLPQQENALIAEMGRLQVQLQGVQDSMNRTQQSKVVTESALAAAQESSSALEELARQIAAGAEYPSELPRGGSAAMATSEVIQRELDALRARYTDSHPMVKAAQGLLAKAREREKNAAALLAAAEEPVAAGPGKPPQAKEISKSFTLSQSLLREKERVTGLQAQREVTLQQLAALEQDKKAILKQLEAVQSRVSRLPVREQELATVNRDYEISKANYQSLLDKKLAAQMATEMERNQKSERFRVLDPARVPERPISPNRPLFGALSGLVALVLGVGLGLGVELRRGTVLGEWEMPGDVPVLGRVPIIPEDATSDSRDGRRRKLRLAAALSVLLLVMAGVVGAGLYLRWFSI